MLYLSKFLIKHNKFSFIFRKIFAYPMDWSLLMKSILLLMTQLYSETIQVVANNFAISDLATLLEKQTLLHLLFQLKLKMILDLVICLIIQLL